MRTSVLAVGALATLALGLVGCSAGTPGDAPAEESSAWPESITLSLVPSVEGEDLAEALDPLTTYLSEHLGIEVERRRRQ